MFGIFGEAKFLNKKERAAYNRLNRKAIRYFLFSWGILVVLALGGVLVMAPIFDMLGTNMGNVVSIVLAIAFVIFFARNARKLQGINRLRHALQEISQRRSNQAFIDQHL